MRLRICGQELVDGLAQYGVRRRKTHRVKPAQLDGDLMPAYWRGVFDGDGSISRCSEHYRRWNLAMAGNEAMVSGFAMWAAGVCGTHARPKRRDHERAGWCVNIGGNRIALRLGHAVYRGATVYLDRKYELYQEMVRTSPPVV